MCILFIESKRCGAFQRVSVRIEHADALHAVFLNITSSNGGFAMAKSLKKSAKRERML